MTGRKRPSEVLDINYFFDRSMPEPNSGCWIWMKALHPNGYGAVRTAGRTRNAHRIAYEVATGAAVPSGVDVCHRCDTRCCVNPDHLFQGSRSVNMRDCSEKGRIRIPMLVGEKCPAAKLTATEVLLIRADSRSQRKLARIYGVDKGTIAGIRKGTTWRSV